MKHHSRGFVLTKGVLLTGLCAGLFASFFPWNKLMIAREGKTRYTIVQSDQATEPEKFAVRELTNFLSRVTGASFPVVAESALSGEVRGIYVGWTKFAAQNGIDAAKLGEEEWIIRSAGKNLIITGGRLRGTLYAVYEFLENQAGCHWLNHNTEVIPSKPTLALAKLNIQGKPTMWQREIYTGQFADDRKMFMERNKDNGRNFLPGGGFGGSGCHTFSYFVNASNWFESHPEYFSLNAEGKRVPAKDSGGPGQLCLTHPDVRRLTLESLRKFITEDRAQAAQKGWPPPRLYDISQNDGSDLCKCTNCQAITAREGGESGPLIDFINAIAEDIEKDYPDILVQTFAYNETRVPPRTLKPRHNVMIRWCYPYYAFDLVRPLNHPYNSSFYEEIQAWGKIASHLAIWDYWVRIDYSGGKYLFPTPYCMIQCIGPNMKLFADMHTENFIIESQNAMSEPGENFQDLKNWLGYKLMVNPSQPVEPLIQTFMEGYYGAASSKMNEYLKYLEERIDKEADKTMVRMAPHNLKYLDLNFFVTAEKLFDEAEQVIKPGSLEALHVQKERWIVDGALLWLWPWLERKLAPEAGMPFDHETVIRRYETNWRAQAKAKEAQYLSEASLTQLTATFRDHQLPEQFRKLPSREVADFNWLTFYPTSYNLPGTLRGTLVADKEATSEMAGYFAGDNAEAHKKPLSFGVTDGATTTLKPEDVPQDEKYHLFKIGRINVKKGACVWAIGALDDNKLGVNVDRLFAADAKDPKVNDWDAYISLKVKGPAYVKGSTETNGVWLDRVLLVKP